MNNPNLQSNRTTVIGATDAKQGNKKRMNLRVLLGSMAALALIGAVLLFVFFRATPAGMDATPTGAEGPASTAPAEPATDAAQTAPPPAATTVPAEPAPAEPPAPSDAQPATPETPAPAPAPAP